MKPLNIIALTLLSFFSIYSTEKSMSLVNPSTLLNTQILETKINHEFENILDWATNKSLIKDTHNIILDYLTDFECFDTSKGSGKEYNNFFKLNDGKIACSADIFFDVCKLENNKLKCIKNYQTKDKIRTIIELQDGTIVVNDTHNGITIFDGEKKTEFLPVNFREATEAREYSYAFLIKAANNKFITLSTSKKVKIWQKINDKWQDSELSTDSNKIRSLSDQYFIDYRNDNVKHLYKIDGQEIKLFKELNNNECIQELSDSRLVIVHNKLRDNHDMEIVNNNFPKDLIQQYLITDLADIVAQYAATESYTIQSFPPLTFINEIFQIKLDDNNLYFAVNTGLGWLVIKQDIDKEQFKTVKDIKYQHESNSYRVLETIGKYIFVKEGGIIKIYFINKNEIRFIKNFTHDYNKNYSLLKLSDSELIAYNSEGKYGNEDNIKYFILPKQQLSQKPAQQEIDKLEKIYQESIKNKQNTVNQAQTSKIDNKPTIVVDMPTKNKDQNSTASLDINNNDNNNSITAPSSNTISFINRVKDWVYNNKTITGFAMSLLAYKVYIEFRR